MDGLRFDLDFRIEELEVHMRENLGEQLIEIKKVKFDMEKHLARKKIPIPVKFKLATIIGLADSSIKLNLELDNLMYRDIGIQSQDDISIYVSYHKSLADLSLKLVELEELANEILSQ